MKQYVTCYKLVNGRLHATRDLTGAAYTADIRLALAEKGFHLQMRTPHRESRAEISVWTSEDPQLPRFYIEVSGEDEVLAVLLAADFVHLAETLRQLDPLIDLIGA